MPPPVSKPPQAGAFTDIQQSFNSENSTTGGSHTLRAKSAW